MTRWTPDRDRRLVEVYAAGGGPKAAARALGISVSGAKSRAKRLGVSTGTRRRWTAAEREIVREHYYTETSAQTGVRIGRTAKSVEQARKRLDVRKLPPVPPETVEVVRAGVAAGLTDAEIARRNPGKFGTADPRTRVTHTRHVLGLPVNPAAILSSRRMAFRTQCDRLGITGGGQLRQLAFKRFAAENGWPEDFRPRAVQIMNLLMDRGPMTRRDLVAALGLKWKPANCGRNNLCSNDPEGSYLANLMARGFVSSTRTFVAGAPHGRCRRPNVYLPTAAAISWREQHVRA